MNWDFSWGLWYLLHKYCLFLAFGYICLCLFLRCLRWIFWSFRSDLRIWCFLCRGIRRFPFLSFFRGWLKSSMNSQMRFRTISIFQENSTSLHRENETIQSQDSLLLLLDLSSINSSRIISLLSMGYQSSDRNLPFTTHWLSLKDKWFFLFLWWSS